jgi:hypothetical protein
MINLKNAASIYLLKIIQKQNLQGIYLIVEIALKIFLIIQVLNASCERSFNNHKLIKNYLRSKLGQERLTSIAILSIEQGFSGVFKGGDEGNHPSPRIFRPKQFLCK